MKLSRRHFIGRTVSLVAASLIGSRGEIAGTAAEAANASTGTVVVGILTEPSQLNSGLTSAGPTQQVSGKIFDGLIAYGLDGSPQPQLATSWDVAADGLSITFQLRPNVLWHDGKPFTSADIAFSVLEIWKQYHSRGRATFANVTRVDTPDALTAVFVLSKPAPYILNALASTESQPVPKHLYEHTDPLTNPYNLTPVGTGPFKFVSWERESHITLSRNPDYWDKPRPYLQQLIFRFLPDPSGIATALQTNSVQLGTPSFVDLAALAKVPALTPFRSDTPFSIGIMSFEFNLDRPVFRDIRVRQAFAHAIDRTFLLRNIWRGAAAIADSPVPPSMHAFHAKNLPVYAYDPVKAEALLEQAGLKRNSDGIRLSIYVDPYPVDVLLQTAQFLRSSLAKIGVQLKVRPNDVGGFITRIYTRRDFDTSIYGASSGPDPAIGIQRFYWSKSFQPGIAFSNGSHYDNPAVDRLLEAAQIELDPQKRKALYDRFQQLVQQDAVTLPLIAAPQPLVGSRTLQDVVVTADALLGNFANAKINA